MLAKRKEEEYEYELYESLPEVPATKIPTRPQRRVRLNTHLRSRCLLLLVLLSVMAMVVTVRSGMSASRGYELVQMQQETTRLEQENERLRIEIAQMKSPERIKTFAAKDLGMTVPQKVYFASGKKE